jgi:MarR family transcriptional regulator, 2-MHQ and catechol-resistance regulon repressor
VTAIETGDILRAELTIHWDQKTNVTRTEIGDLPDELGASESAGPADPAPRHGERDRHALEQELLDQMASWSPRDRGHMFKSWHRHALSLVHLNVLTAIEAGGPISMKRLSEAMDVTDASATGIVDRMEKRGLVERRHATEDRRVVLVHLTEAGRAVFSQMAEHRRETLRLVLSELTDDEVSALLVGMKALKAARARVVAAEYAAQALASPPTA